MLVRCRNCFHEFEKEYGVCPVCAHWLEDESGDIWLPVDTKLNNRYVIEEMVGAGGFGITYKAKDTFLGSVVAIKEYYPRSIASRNLDTGEVFLVAIKKENEFIKGKKRFLDEARNMVKFDQHRNIVNVSSYFEENNTAYIIMEYLDGMTLRKALQKQNKPFTTEEAKPVVVAVCDALESMHKEGILHRDVSPDNIIICKDGTVKLLDFGAARFSKEVTPDTEVSIIVKPGFTPPEQYHKVNEQDGRTDLYALGATLYYSVTGVKPEESRDRRKEDTLQEPKALVPEISEYMNNAIMRAMQIKMEDRFESIEEFRRVLEKEEVVPTDPPGDGSKSWGKIAAFLLLLCVGALSFLMLREPQINGGDIELWYVTTGNEAIDGKTAATWEQVIGAFMEEYPDITVKATGVAEGEYVEKVTEAQKNGTLPYIYESTILPDALLHEAVTFEKLMKQTDAIYLDALEGQNNTYPTGLVIPTVYVNTTLGQLRDAKTVVDMIAACKEVDSALLVSEKAAEMYEKIYGVELQEYVNKEAVNSFVKGECFMYLGTTEDYFACQELMKNGNGRYAIVFPGTKEAIYEYGCQWSSNEQDKEIGKIVCAFLEFLNSNYAQDYFNIQNFAHSGCLPVTESGLEAFVEVDQDLNGIQEYMALPYYEEK